MGPFGFAMTLLQAFHYHVDDVGPFYLREAPSQSGGLGWSAPALFVYMSILR